MIFFRKIFLLAFILSAFFSAYSYAEIVKKVEVVGNERISEETVKVFGDVVVGKDYDSKEVNLLIKKLYQSELFSNISVQLKNNKLTIIVKENPFINAIIFDGEKAEKYKEKIKELLILREKGSFIDANVKNDINLIKSFYKSLGFYFVKIDAEIERLEKNRVNVVYTIDKGKKAKIAKIYFLGDKKIKGKRLREVITSEENRFWKFISRNVYLNKERIDLDKRLLTNYYKNKGYYEVDITSSNVEYAEGEGFVLTFSINAGKRYKFKKIFANVDGALSKEAFLSLESEFNKLVGKYYSPMKLNKILEKIDKLSEQKELQFINHNIVETLEDDFVEVAINIFEGEKVIVERINIVGNSVTNDDVIRSEMLVDEGDPYSELLVNKSINEIKSRRIFSSVDYKTLPGSSDDLKILEVTVEETSTGEVMAGAGVSTDGTSFQFSVKENNWMGKGIAVDSFLSLQSSKVRGSLSIDNPNWNYSGNSLIVGIDVSSTDRSGTTGYASKKTGFSLGTNFEQYEDIRLSPTINVILEDIEAEADSSAQIKKMDGNFFNADFSYGLTLDKRNQSFQPTEGYITQFRQSIPLIQDSSSLMNSITISTYKDFSEDIIGSLKFYAKTIHGIDDDVRLTNRLYIPRNRLRGFNTAKVGPKDGADYVGGNYTGSVNAEAQFPNLLPEAFKTDISLFLDAANVWEVDYSDTISDSNTIRSSVGLNANVTTPVGPLSFTLAQDLTKDTNDEAESFNFRLGTSF